jgi:hypothetical protein
MMWLRRGPLKEKRNKRTMQWKTIRIKKKVMEWVKILTLDKMSLNKFSLSKKLVA